MTSFYTSFHIDPNEAAKRVDVICYTTHIASLLIAPSHSHTNYKMATIFGLPYESFIDQFMKVGGIKTWKELVIGVQQLIRLLANNNFINPGLVL